MKNNIMKELIDEFLLEKTHHMYKNHCEKFLNYITLIANKENKPVAIDKNDIVQSVGYYSKLGKINTVSAMTNHLEAIKAFFENMQKKEKLNNIFGTIPAYSEFKDSIVQQYNLDDTKGRDILPESTVIELLKYFDKNTDNNDKNLLMIKLFTKLTLIAPAKKKVIAGLKFSDFRDDYRKLIVNKVEIKIPNMLRSDILSVLKNKEKDIKLDMKFFEYIYTGTYRDNVFNGSLCFALKQIGYDIPAKKRSFSVEAIMNTAIAHMIKSNTDTSLIAKINGLSISTIEKKMRQLGVEIPNHNYLINSAIMSASYYQYI